MPSNNRRILELCFEHAAESPCQKMGFGSYAFQKERWIGAWATNGWYRNGLTSPPVPCGRCLREGVQSGTRIELCRALHAEQAAIMRALYRNVNLQGGELFVAGLKADGQPYLKLSRGFYCTLCARMALAVGISTVIVPVKSDDPSGWEPAVMTAVEVWQYAYDVAEGRVVPQTTAEGTPI